ncbi:hypothetical protein MBM_06337 [Drepanopeziza brunnea f. sp. 'multigermtubi' MB_m1]|uniref:Uncharacterized protein n=1 Tax=Marssonina brunnea f. sp. multigermtubi (strain MB_m1) TaxID=1072389 RepID=K1XT97_MARBU|nr:uncharacterized protein MBM_06337 [Drepanopeziza brunnea f. sp. 'multigermtubi' MB_m1]EKD15709.1 hypothetical protein MBM_06337 [Drepanopeziza brunnea f. sp. 'multigermtubi' MB_m1]
MSFVTSGPTSFEDNQDRSSFGALQKKLRLWYYQYEVTFSLYMLEPTEKIVLNAFVLSMFSLMLYGVVYFMPEFVIQFVTKGISSLFWVYVNDSGNQLLLDDAVAPWVNSTSSMVGWDERHNFRQISYEMDRTTGARKAAAVSEWGIAMPRGSRRRASSLNRNNSTQNMAYNKNGCSHL